VEGTFGEPRSLYLPQDRSWCVPADVHPSAGRTRHPPVDALGAHDRAVEGAVSPTHRRCRHPTAHIRLTHGRRHSLGDIVTDRRTRIGERVTDRW